jgi:F0F1-type ATP synthase membrane subunit b/b'
MRAETARLIEEAKSEVSRQALAARGNLESEARAMAATISTQILNRPVTSGGNQ